MSASTVGTISGVDLPGGSVESRSNIGRLLYSHGGIYFTVPGGTIIERMPVSGGSIATVTGGTTPLAILGANSSSLFLYDGSVIGSVPLPSGDGGKPKPLITAAVNPNVDGGLAIDETSMYWAGNGVASTCQIANCSGTLRVLPKRTVDRIDDVGIDGDAIYWLADSGDATTPAVSTVWKLAK